MPSTYFIADFAYNPDATKILAIFELGNAFYSEYPNKAIGHEQLSPSQYLYEDIKKQHQDPVFLHITPSGLDLKALNDNQFTQTFDKENMSWSIHEVCPSYKNLAHLVSSIVLNAGKNETNRELVIHAAHPDLYRHYYDEKNNPHRHINFLNHTSENLLCSLYNKATLAKYANNSPIFPGTLIIPAGEQAQALDIDVFLHQYPSDHYVIKPAMGSHAKGVHVVTSSQLKHVLAQTPPNDHGSIVQVCHVSKQLHHHGASYYAKSRAILRVDFLPDHTEPHISVITAFWQLAACPVAPLLNDHNVIANMDVHQNGVLEMSTEDLRHITHLFKLYLPSIIKKMQHQDPVVSTPQTTPAPDQTRLAHDLLSFLQVQSILPYYTSTLFDRDLITKKHFIIDVLGLDKTLHDNVPYSGDSLEAYVKHATAIFCGNKKQTLNHLSWACFLKQETPNVLLIITAVALNQMLFSYLRGDNTNANHPKLALLNAVIQTVLMSLGIALVRNPVAMRAAHSFFKPEVRQDEANINTSQPSHACMK